MKKTIKTLSLVALLVLAGCETLPTGPSVRVLPAPGKSFEQFMAEDAICRDWSARSIGVNPGEVAQHHTASGAAIGTLVGAGAGAAIGAAAGSAGVGAAIGAGSGLLLGTASGASYGEAAGYEAQRRYDNTYVQCMYAKGNQVPGVIRTYPASRHATPPPPPEGSVPPDYVPAH